MITVALVLGVAGFMLSVVALICIGVYLAWKKPKPMDVLPDGVYHIRLTGRNKLTGAPQYEFEDVGEGEVVKKG